MKKYLPILIVVGAFFIALLIMTYVKPQKHDVLDETIWKVVYMDNTPLLEETTLTIRFHKRKVKGSSGCNTFSGRYEVEEDSIKITDLELTTANCMNPKIMQQEKMFTGLLEQISQFTLSDEELTTITNIGDVVRFVSLLSN
jgi:heat shock protein HslJ